MVYEITDSQSLDKVMNSAYDIVIIDIYADWCQPCKYMAPKYAELAARYSSPNILFTKLNTSTGLKNNVNGLPSIEFWVNKKLFHTVLGADVKEIEATLNKLIAPPVIEQRAAKTPVGGYPPSESGYAPKSSSSQYMTYSQYGQQ